MKKVECTFCYGVGYYNDSYITSKGKIVKIKQPCLNCNGTGFIEEANDGKDVKKRAVSLW